MKKLLVLSLAFLPLMSMAQDDLYFVAKKPKKAATEQVDIHAKAERVNPTDVVDYHVSRRGDDEYNRRYTVSGNSSRQAIDTLVADTAYGGEGYDDCIDDPEADFRYSRRLVRFHSPRFYAAASPYYWDLYYGYGAWDYLYDPYDPWYWDYGWGCGWSWGPWSTWYGGIWGYRPLHAWAYWGWGPGWYGSAIGHPIHRNTVPRELNSSRGHMASYDRLRTSAARGGLVSAGRTSALGSRGAYAGSRSSTGTRSSAIGVRGLSESTRTSVIGGTRRDNAAYRAATRRGDYNVPTRTRSNEGSSTRYDSSPTRTSPTRSTTTTTTTRSTSDFSSPSRSSFGGGGSFGGGSRGGGFGGGGSRGGGGGGGRR